MSNVSNTRVPPVPRRTRKVCRGPNKFLPKQRKTRVPPHDRRRQRWRWSATNMPERRIARPLLDSIALMPSNGDSDSGGVDARVGDEVGWRRRVSIA